MLFAADGIQFKGKILDSPALGFLAVRVLGIRRLFAIHLYFGVRPHDNRLDECMFLVPVKIRVEEFLQGRGIAPRLLNRVGIVSDFLVDIFANFATELVLVQKFAHGLLGTRPNHATHARNCKERGGMGEVF